MQELKLFGRAPPYMRAGVSICHSRDGASFSTQDGWRPAPR